MSDIREYTSGICLPCKKGEHERCPMVITSAQGHSAFCSCRCTGDTSLGMDPADVPRIPKKVKKQFSPHEGPDPLDSIFQ